MNEGGGNRYERARKLLDQGASHVDESIGRVRRLVDDWKAVAAEALETGSYPSERIVPDALAFSLNTLQVLTCLPEGGVIAKPNVPSDDDLVVVPLGGESTIILNASPLPKIRFDFMSEMAGPVEIALDSATLAFVRASDLVRIDAPEKPPIPAANVLVRILGNRLIVTLVGLKTVFPSEYAGTFTLSGFSEEPGERTFRLEAKCFSRLFF